MSCCTSYFTLYVIPRQRDKVCLGELTTVRVILVRYIGVPRMSLQRSELYLMTKFDQATTCS